MQRPRLLLLCGILIFLILTARLLLLQYNAYDDEIEWYRNSLGYDFTCRIDSAKVFHENGNGFLYCSVISGTLDPTKEDSLSVHVKHYKRLRLLRFKNSAIEIFSGSADTALEGDLIYINSASDTYRYIRNDEVVRNLRVYDTIMKRYF